MLQRSCICVKMQTGQVGFPPKRRNAPVRGPYRAEWAVGTSETFELQRMLRKVGLKTTAPRARVLEALLRAEEPVSHRELVRDPALRDLDRVSVYRALRAFVEKGLAYRLVSEDRVGRFVASTKARSHPRHPHFLCRRCGRLECLTRIRMPSLGLRKIGHLVERQSWVLEGICASCLSE